MAIRRHCIRRRASWGPLPEEPSERQAGCRGWFGPVGTRPCWVLPGGRCNHSDTGTRSQECCRVRGLSTARLGSRVPKRVPNRAFPSELGRRQGPSARRIELKRPSNRTLQNRQGGAAPRLEGSIPSPRRGGRGFVVVRCGRLVGAQFGDRARKYRALSPDDGGGRRGRGGRGEDRPGSSAAGGRRRHLHQAARSAWFPRRRVGARAAGDGAMVAGAVCAWTRGASPRATRPRTQPSTRPLTPSIAAVPTNDHRRVDIPQSAQVSRAPAEGARSMPCVCKLRSRA